MAFLSVTLDPTNNGIVCGGGGWAEIEVCIFEVLGMSFFLGEPTKLC